MFFLLINWILTGIFIAFPGKRQFQIASFMGFAIICSLISIEFSLLFSTKIKKIASINLCPVSDVDFGNQNNVHYLGEISRFGILSGGLNISRSETN